MVFQQRIAKLRDRELDNLHPGQDAFKPAIWFIFYLICAVIILVEVYFMCYGWNNILPKVMPELPHMEYEQMLFLKLFFEIFK